MNLERLFGPVIVLQRLIVKEHAMDVRRSLMVFIGLLEVVIPVSAQTNDRWAGPSNADLQTVLAEVEPVYLELHRNPELSLEETRTSTLLADRMRGLVLAGVHSSLWAPDYRRAIPVAVKAETTMLLQVLQR